MMDKFGKVSMFVCSKLLTTINLFELSQLCEDAELFDAMFGMRELLVVFMRVNIDDDLFVQEDKANSASELVFDEFSETIARIHGIRWSKAQAAAREMDGGDPKVVDEEAEEGLEQARDLDEWLQTSFLPEANAAIKARRSAR